MWTWIELSKSAIQENVRIFQRLTNSSTPVFVLKSNAYGHGLAETYEMLKDLNLPFLAVNYVFEGVLLRDLGFKGRIMMVGPFLPEEMETAYNRQIELFIGYEAGIDLWLGEKNRPGIHIEFDTGMSRQGMPPEIASKISAKILATSEAAAQVKGVCMHFANVEDVTEHSYADLQLERFSRVRSQFSSPHYQLEFHAASSASTLIMDSSHFDLCRVGITLYGLWPSLATKISYSQLHPQQVEGFKPVLTWKAKVTSLNDVMAGQFIGYGCTFKARKNMRVAVIPVGYFEGYARAVSGSPAYVLIQGQRCPIVGRVCMNMMMVDVSDLHAIKVGDVVTLVGRDGDEVISASDVADWSKTIHYEFVTRLNANLRRIIVS